MASGAAAMRRRKPTKAAQRATEALVRPLQFKTRDAYDAYLVQRAQERAELRARNVPPESIEAITGEVAE